jgi:hypothetical protein
MNYRRPVFLEVVPTHRKTKKERQQDGRGGKGSGGGPNHTTTRKNVPLKIIQYSLLDYLSTLIDWLDNQKADRAALLLSLSRACRGRILGRNWDYSLN